MPFDPTITQKVRSALIEDGHSDLVIETITKGMRQLELALLEAKRDIKLLQDAERDRVTQTGVYRAIKIYANKQTAGAAKWAVRIGIGFGLTLLGGLAGKYMGTK